MMLNELARCTNDTCPMRHYCERNPAAVVECGSIMRADYYLAERDDGVELRCDYFIERDEE